MRVHEFFDYLIDVRDEMHELFDEELSDKIVLCALCDGDHAIVTFW